LKNNSNPQPSKTKTKKKDKKQKQKQKQNKLRAVGPQINKPFELDTTNKAY
jgi:hypothetical protein